MSYDVGNFRILTGLVQVENDTNLHGYLDVGFRVDYLDTAGYNTTKQWIERQTAPATETTEATWEAISFEFGSSKPIMLPFVKDWRTPSFLVITDLTSSSFPTHKKTISDSRAASLGELKKEPPQWAKWWSI